VIGVGAEANAVARMVAEGLEGGVHAMNTTSGAQRV
jgi:hypothetical protein